MDSYGSREDQWRDVMNMAMKISTCSIPCIKGSFIMKPTNAFFNYILCLLITPTCFGRLLRPSSGYTVLKSTIKVVCVANQSKI